VALQPARIAGGDKLSIQVMDSTPAAALVPGPYELVPLSAEDASRWDELVMTYPGYEIFHRQAWLDYLAESRGVSIRQWAVCKQGRRLGLFCGGEVRKGPFRILGSPLKGWYTNSMGALLDAGADPVEFLRALDSWAKREGIAMVEFEQNRFPEDVLAAAGFEPMEDLTYRVELDDEESMLKRLHKSRRYGVRKALASGLQAEICETSEVAGEFYDRFCATMRRKGVAPGFPRSHPRLLLEHLRRVDRILGLRIRDSQGRLLSVGLFPFDNQTLYFWGGADSVEGRELFPNDFLHWSAMRLGRQRGLRCYDMSGYGRFKSKFGGELVTLRRWHKAYWRSARWARKAYAFCHRQRLLGRAWLLKFSQAPGSPAANDKDGEEG
jgi:hypothetical protein